jgi:hypothetical protein
MTYKEKQTDCSIDLIKKGSIFNQDPGGGDYDGKEIAHILKDSSNNFFKPIQENVKIYFKENNISWWGGKHPTGNVLSSQIACLNHLFLFRNDKDAVLAIAQTICPDFTDVFRIETDTPPSYIQFEAVSKIDHLNEGKPTRGNNCTSIDVLLFVLHKNGFKFLVPIEWKYTEIYYNENNATGSAGAVRQSRYTNLIESSSQLKHCDHSCYYYEPFYQLMRQTLWAEQMIKNKTTEEKTQADDYLHINVIPDNNCDLLCKQYQCSGRKMEETWRDHLNEQSKYQIISPEKLLSNIDRIKYKELIDYLSTRYWNDKE